MCTELVPNLLALLVRKYEKYLPIATGAFVRDVILAARVQRGTAVVRLRSVRRARLPLPTTTKKNRTIKKKSLAEDVALSY